MKHKGSKRQRKNKNAGSLKKKQTPPDADLWGLLDEELREKYEGMEDAAVVSGTKTKQESSDQDDKVQELSRSEQRKLKQIQQKKERQQALGQALDSLRGTALSNEHLALMRPLHQRGAKESRRQQLRRALQLQRAGLPVPVEARLMQRTGGRTGAAREPGGSSGSSDEVQGVRCSIGKGLGQQQSSGDGCGGESVVCNHGDGWVNL